MLGESPAQVREEDSVPLGTGLVDVGAALFAAETAGVEHYYLEEEAVDAIPQIRQSLSYLAGFASRGLGFLFQFGKTEPLCRR